MIKSLIRKAFGVEDHIFKRASLSELVGDIVPEIAVPLGNGMGLISGCCVLYFSVLCKFSFSDPDRYCPVL